MGFIVNDEIKFDNGVSLIGCYYTLRGECMIQRQQRGGIQKYVVSGYYDIYGNHNLYTTSKPLLMGRQYSEVVLSTLINKEPLTELYNVIKSNFNSVTDI